MLGEADALLAQITGLLVGEVELDGGGALVGYLLGQFMAVGARREDQRDLGLGDFGAPYGQSLTVVARLRLGERCGRKSGCQQ